MRYPISRDSVIASRGTIELASCDVLHKAEASGGLWVQANGVSSCVRALHFQTEKGSLLGMMEKGSLGGDGIPIIYAGVSPAGPTAKYRDIFLRSEQP